MSCQGVLHPGLVTWSLPLRDKTKVTEAGAGTGKGPERMTVASTGLLSPDGCSGEAKVPCQGFATVVNERAAHHCSSAPLRLSARSSQKRPATCRGKLRQTQFVCVHVCGGN